MSDGTAVVHYDLPSPGDLRRSRMRAKLIPPALTSRIPRGLETQVLRLGGFRQWRDLYVPRQLDLLLASARVARRLRTSVATRDRLLLAICGAAEMAGRLSRWDRYYPKAFEALANHRYAVIGLACETNPFAAVGRGTLYRRFRALARAARWMGTPTPRRVVARAARRAGSVRFRSGLVVVRGSSERQLLANNSIDLVLTDPPYFDDVQYSELATLFVAWAHATGLLEADVRPDAQREAVPNRTRGTDAATYERLLTRIFAETRRVLRPGGAMILTFHNTNSTAWIALSRALRAAGFCIRALAVVRSENDTDHAKRGRRGFTKDLVLECSAGREPDKPAVVVRSRDEQDRELLAIGRAMSAREALDAHAIANALSHFNRPRVAVPFAARQAS